MSLGQYLKELGVDGNLGRVIAFDGEHYHIATQTGVRKAQDKRLTIGDYVSCEESNFKVSTRKNSIQYRNQTIANFDGVLFLFALTDELDYGTMLDVVVKVWDSGVTPYFVIFTNGATDAKKIHMLKHNLPGVDVYIIDEKTPLKGVIGKFFKPQRLMAVVSHDKNLQQAFLESFGVTASYEQEIVALAEGAFVLTVNVNTNADKSQADTDFLDIGNYASQCRFKDCKHQSEPGCKVREALEKGLFTEEHYEKYLKEKGIKSYETEFMFDKNGYEKINKKHNRFKERNLY